MLALQELGKLDQKHYSLLVRTGVKVNHLIQVVNFHDLLINTPAEWTYVPGPRMFGGNPSLDVLTRVTFTLSNKIRMDWRSEENSWLLNWLGVSAEFTVLRAFFSIKTPTVRAAYEELCNTARRLKRSPVARVLFKIQDTVRKNCPMTADGVDFLSIAVEIGSRADGMLDIAKRTAQTSTSRLSCKRSHDNRSCYISKLFRSAATHRDISMMKILVEALEKYHDEAHCSGDIGSEWIASVMQHVYAWDPEELKDGFTLRDYIQLLIEGGILSKSPPVSCCHEDRPKVAVSEFKSVTIDELVMLCPPVQRPKLYCAISQYNSGNTGLISDSGIFTAALEGTQNLSDYLHCCKQNNAFEIQVAMQECLVFAVILNDTQTASALVQLGVDPEVGLLSANQERYHRGDTSWNPMVIAAAEGRLGMLQLLSETSDLDVFLRMAPFYEICHVEDRWMTGLDNTGRELRRLENLRRSFRTSRNLAWQIANGTDWLWASLFNGDQELWELESTFSMTDTWFSEAGTRGIETITWIRAIATANGSGFTVDKEIIKAALCHDRVRAEPIEGAYHPCDILLLNGLVDANLEYHQDEVDLLQLSIRAECSLDVVKFLLSKGLRVHSRAAAQSGNTMLHDALLSRSHDRSKIVYLLLQEGADYKMCGEGLTILEASVDHPLQTVSDPEYLDIFTHLFEAGAPVVHKPRPQLTEREPLICRLLCAEAEDDLILRVVDAGAELNDCGPGGERETPLVLAILKRREELAQELVRHGADVHAPVGDGHCTALQAACEACLFHFIEYLINVQGVDVNEAPQEDYGNTGLQSAVETGSMALVEFLLDHGADVNALSGNMYEIELPDRNRALDVAAGCGHLDMVEFLLKAGGRSSVYGLGGAIQIAKARGHFTVASVLLDWEKQHGMRLREEEVEWQRRHPDAARLLLESSNDDNCSDSFDLDGFIEG